MTLRHDTADRMHPTLARLLFWPTLLWNMLLGRVLPVRRWWDHVDPMVIVGALPLRRDVPKLANLGVRAVVNMCDEYPGPESEYRKAGIEQIRVPTIDFNSPIVEDVERAVDYIDQQVSQGKIVYVHCKAGRARSATVALCWLVAARGMTPEQAQKTLLEHRPHVKPDIDRRPVVAEFLARRNIGSSSGSNRDGR